MRALLQLKTHKQSFPLFQLLIPLRLEKKWRRRYQKAAKLAKTKVPAKRPNWYAESWTGFPMTKARGKWRIKFSKLLLVKIKVNVLILNLFKVNEWFKFIYINLEIKFQWLANFPHYHTELIKVPKKAILLLLQGKVSTNRQTQPLVECFIHNDSH